MRIKEIIRYENVGLTISANFVHHEKFKYCKNELNALLENSPLNQEYIYIYIYISKIYIKS